MIDEEKEKIVFSSKDFVDEIDARITSSDTIMWDDITLFMYKTDNIDKIQKDAKILIVEYIKEMGKIHSSFTSMRNAFREMHLRNAFLLQLLMLFKRMDGLKND